MKKEFSTAWKASSQPRKQRKFTAKAPIHIKRKTLCANLSKDLRKKHERRSIVVRKGDTVKVTRGKYAKKQGKVLEVKMKLGKIYIEGVNTKKMDGSQANVSIRPSNLQIIEMNSDDSKRIKKKVFEEKR